MALLQVHTMIIIQLWSKCRLRIVFPERVKIEIQLFIGWKALTMLIIILPLVFSFWRFVEADFQKYCFVNLII